MTADWYSTVKAMHPDLADLLQSLVHRVDQLEDSVDSIADQLWPDGDNGITSLPARHLTSVPKPPDGAAPGVPDLMANLRASLERAKAARTDGATP